MANENINLANRLNNFKDSISNFKNFQEFFDKSGERNQKAIIHILENLPKNIKEYSENFTKNLLFNYDALVFAVYNERVVLSENINTAIDVELRLKDFRDKGYISSAESYELSQTSRKLSMDGMGYLNNNNEKEFISVLQKNRNNDSLKQNNSYLFEEVKKILKKNELEISKEKNLEEERDKKFEDILKNLRINQPEKYDQVLEIMKVTDKYLKSRYIKDALLEIYEKDEANGTKVFDMGINKTMEKIIDKIISINYTINVDLKKFVAMAVTLNPENQKKLYKALKMRNKNEFITEVMNLYEKGDTKKIDIVINRKSLVQKLYERGDFNLEERNEFSQILNELSELNYESAEKFIKHIEEDLEDGAIKKMLLASIDSFGRTFVAREKLAKHKNLTANFQKISLNFSTSDEKGRDNINKVCEIFEKVTQKYWGKFEADLINLSRNDDNRERIDIVIEKEYLLVKIREQGDFTQDDRRRFSQVVNDLDDMSAKLLLNKVRNALERNASRESIMSTINGVAINNQRHRPLQMLIETNKLVSQSQNKKAKIAIK